MFGVWKSSELTKELVLVLVKLEGSCLPLSWNTYFRKLELYRISLSFSDM
jgi:hypothetical protein